MSTTDQITEQIWAGLKTVIDPELNIDIVSLGLIYEVNVQQQPHLQVHIVMTLTTPGCPLAGVFDAMVRDGLRSVEGLDVEQNVQVELTFDPPWTTDMMSEEAKAELGF